jgi:hypothetical protein
LSFGSVERFIEKESASECGHSTGKPGRPKHPREQRLRPANAGSEKEHGFLDGSKSLKREIKAGAGFCFKRKSERHHRKVVLII